MASKTTTGKKATEEKKVRGVFEKVPGSGVWWIQWFDAEGKRHREKAGTKSQAKALVTKRQAEKLQGIKLPELNRKRDLTLKELLAKYLPEIRANKKDHATDERIGALWVEAFPEEGIGSITSGDIERVKSGWLADKLKPATVNRRLAMLKTLYGKAVRDDVTERNPLEKRRVKMLRESPPRERILSAEEEAAILKLLSPFDALAVILALHTGLRITEQLERTREDVDLKRGLLHIPEAKGGGRQQVHLNAVARNALEQILASHSHPWIFPDADGQGPLSRFTLGPRFAKACAKLTKMAKEKQEGGFDLTGMTWHGLRHTFISRLVMLGTPLPTVQKLARHKSIQMTLKYSHLYPEHLTEALGNLASGYPRD